MFVGVKHRQTDRDRGSQIKELKMFVGLTNRNTYRQDLRY